jgi:hypothetical protein
MKFKAYRKLWGRLEIRRRKSLNFTKVELLALSSFLKAPQAYALKSRHNKIAAREIRRFLAKKPLILKYTYHATPKLEGYKTTDKPRNRARHGQFYSETGVNFQLRRFGVRSKIAQSFYPRNMAESALIKLYSRIYVRTEIKIPLSAFVNRPVKSEISRNKPRARGYYLKHLVRLRYRWVYRPKLKQFKLFKKFFLRIFKRYRKISKNRLFATKLHEHFPKLTGFSERSLFRAWAPIRKNYTHYWGHSNALQRFSQSLLLMPASVITFLGFTPSRAAAKHIIRSGIISINGLAAVLSRSLTPGDILQINTLAWKKCISFFDYQRWTHRLLSIQQLSFIQADYASMMFMLFRWPQSYELIAPTFLTERWLRYYIRRFPVKPRNFKKVSGNWKTYKQLPKR